MVKYENYPPVKETTFLKIFWTLQTLVLLPAILQTLETWTHIRIEPPQLMMHLLSGFAGFLIISELLFLTYLITTVLAAATVYILVRKKKTGMPIHVDIAVFSVFLVLCIIGLVSSRSFLDAAMSI